MNGINVILALMVIGSFLLAMVLHESAHALVATWLGDSTPRTEGRQTLRLSPHIDPVGTLMCVILAFQPLITFITAISSAPVGLGWGKPVKPDPWKMRVGANTGVLTVASAGPIFNLVIGILVAILIRFIAPLLPVNEFTIRLLQLLIVFASVNICLTLFNLIPLYPLDGYQILYTLLPSRQAVQFAKSAPYGQFIILALFFLLPFLARLSGLGDFFLFRLWYYFLTGSLSLIGVIVGNTDLVTALYIH